MQACIENASLPLLESVPTWTIRVARPTAPDRNELAKELSGVPKASLRQVFGKLLGTRLWQHHRTAISTTTKPAPVAPISTNKLVSDAEISSGMLRYLCAEAATTLRDRNRFAKSVALTVRYPNGESETARTPLLTAANDATALEAAARLAIRHMRFDSFVSLKLDVAATTAPFASEQAANRAQSHAPSTHVA
jgi:hypothetical protein